MNVWEVGMPRPVALVELGMEARAAISEVRRGRAKLYEAVLALGDPEATTLAQCLDTTLWVAGQQARNLTAYVGGTKRQEVAA